MDDLEPEHLELAEIAKLLADDPASKVCRHLAATCPTCGERLRQVEEVMKRFRHWNPEVAVLEGLEGESLLADLLAAGHGSAGWSEQVEKREELQTWGVAWVALERARELIAEEASRAEALDLALLAAAIAERLGDFYHPEWVFDLKALAYATATAASGPPGADLIDARLKHAAAAVTALEKGTGDESVARDVGELLSRVLRVESEGAK
jgi:hypothetical protein